jgi:5-formyltetrahydrofolate cyclo-ligase
MAQSTAIEDAKAELRVQARARRDALPASARAAAARAIAARPFPVALTPRTIVSGFMPLGSEISPIALMRMLAAAGAQLALPVVCGRGKPLSMRAFSFGQRLVPGVWGIREPAADAAEVFPDILLVPLLAFDRGGHRIGYGAGHYDHTFAHLRKSNDVTGIGLAFSVQETPAIPALSHDVALDFVLTEKDVFDFRSK